MPKYIIQVDYRGDPDILHEASEGGTEFTEAEVKEFREARAKWLAVRAKIEKIRHQQFWIRYNKGKES